jgi:phosphoglycerate dehydrogenase-like enzyme
MSVEDWGDITIHFAHPAYRLAECFAGRASGIAHFQTWTRADMRARIGETEVLVTSGFWDNALLDKAERLRFIQVCAAGYDAFDLDRLKARGIRLANASGVNVNAVSEHAMALVLAFTRKLGEARDNQNKAHWRGMISEIARREDELPGKTMLIYGLGAIGTRLSSLARAFGMRVIAIKRKVVRGGEAVDELHPPAALMALLPQADFVVLTCPLTDETRGLIGPEALGAMRHDAYLINVARGPCVDEKALIAALGEGRIAGAGIDVTETEPLDASSPLWGFDNVILTPHTAGETRRYEANVITILEENLQRLAVGRQDLLKGIV